MAQWDLAPYQDLLTRMEHRRQVLLDDAARLRAGALPLKFLQQQAHFTTPASHYEMVQKAVEGGLSATPRILDKLGISLTDVSETLEVPLPLIESVLSGDPRSPFVMVDGEDAQALRDDVVERGRANAIRIFREASWGRTLRFYRPSGLNLDYCLQDLVIVLTEAGRGLPPERYPIDGIVWPKVEHPAELQLVVDLLSRIEERLGLPRNRIRLEFLVESGWAVAQLPQLVQVAIPRLAGIIWGIADYSADIGLPRIANNHPVCDFVRATIVNLAGTIGVPAIDNMTVNYPVPDKRLDAAGNRAMILARLKEVFADARHGAELGMDGKWVGHPLQLFAVRLAYRAALTEDDVRTEVEKIEAYTRAVAAEQGATIIEGVMSDRATDRHARQKLRKAVALGLLAPAKALELGIIDAAEAREVEAG